jgi:hypothetical protein
METNKVLWEDVLNSVRYAEKLCNETFEDGEKYLLSGKHIKLQQLYIRLLAEEIDSLKKEKGEVKNE